MLAVSTTQIHLQLSVVVVVVIVVVVVYVRLVQPEEDIESKMPYGSLLTPMIWQSLELSPKMGQNLSEMSPNGRAKFHTDR